MHGFDAVLQEHLGQAIGLGDITDNQTLRRIGDGRDITLDEVVVGDRIVSMTEQPAKAGAADVAGPAGEEDLHRMSLRAFRIISAAPAISGASR